MSADIPKEFQLWICSHPKKCGWSGLRSELKFIPDTSMIPGATKGTCPKCGDNSFYVKDSRKVKPPKPVIDWQQRAIAAEQKLKELTEQSATVDKHDWPDCKQVQCEQAHEVFRVVFNFLGITCPDNIYVVGKAVRVMEAINGLCDRLLDREQRVRELKEWISKADHLQGCVVEDVLGGPKGQCSCGRDALKSNPEDAVNCLSSAKMFAEQRVRELEAGILDYQNTQANHETSCGYRWDKAVLCCCRVRLLDALKSKL